MKRALAFIGDVSAIDCREWEDGSYRPTPTIIEAATALYNGHSVAEISRSDAGGAELHRTTQFIGDLIADARAHAYKAICFVTGVPGAGKTLIGLNVATKHFLKPLAIDIRPKADPVHWFLGGKHDVRSSYYLEDVTTEFDIQGLELDWVCVTWDADFRHTNRGWTHHSFRGNRWQRISKPERQKYLKNAYRVLLTRARQGMVIVVPPGERTDPTRDPAYYDPTFEYLKGLDFEIVK